MCGILGIVAPTGPLQLFERALDTLHHRGPDGSGVWEDPTGHIMLGHRRLSILDLSENGKQPMHYLDRYVVTFNGEIYNFDSLKQQLAHLGHTFRTQCDTEVVLAAYAQWGPDCLARFNGMWAIGIWDRSEQTLFWPETVLG